MENFVKSREKGENLRQQDIEALKVKEVEQRRAATREVAKFRERVSHDNV